jgi:3'-phosphoadenosine 5'-phosphosulfate sulfotransferase (PAPS reductase)/FAD synthetase
VTDPFKIDGPTAISFSGGRTSAYMLWRVLQAHGGKLPEGVEVCFANTGKEREETLEFVRDCSQRWGVPIRWIEYRNDEAGFALVDFDTASRDGEPFAAIIKKRNYLPNPMARFCTVELKIMPQREYLRSIGWTDWDDMVGIRADEPRRVAKIRANPSGGHAGPERAVPLADAGVTKKHVGAFWKSQPFDLGLRAVNGVTMEGNCDLCFLKGANIVLTSIKAEPPRAAWWIGQEGSITNAKIENGGSFRNDRPSYQQMLNYALAQQDLFADEDESIACFCGD